MLTFLKKFIYFLRSILHVSITNNFEELNYFEMVFEANIYPCILFQLKTNYIGK